MKSLKFLTALFITTILTACTLDAERPTNMQYLDKTDATWQQHLQKIEKIQQYRARGQIGYISPSERFSSRFEWQYQNPQSYTLKLYSLISKSTLLIEMQPQGMTISDNNGNRQSARNAKLLLQEMIGMNIPLEHLAYWMKGQPAVNSDYKVGMNHLLGTFSYPFDDSTWTADYLTYHTENSMPENILLKNQNTSQTLKIRVVEWAF
ncbi:lipoprotein insertase outer membrane protein LolB [Rodentibacter pneumotropicus]|uniref:lipoprotein insertase outer membrane protein LolB n=1 Tax=Rodentibacter pneumotropicus TaxID=758 RepID=UPI00037BDAD1|nr:lipoprotein insertase outer membrane protein LolB [Rodentibacter pneumotropicus]MDC2824888.1 lipoprotein insertase outer membrane protein LolB [Rodentibacter pneumotropicus]NBH75797.1 outer membrane lipoprotein LolB [Rodentibacter pneumotropicus]OOF61061.1 lipoprotein localization factor LolB [Rodentibacter pneumotropicus]THA02115.1 outer membrane lipoprotein LolB [Rodentibacter pneumotropicus]THA06399.1 outer membrane lipoprotein LolB [Rodentibacter pneumotropicus]